MSRRHPLARFALALVASEAAWKALKATVEASDAKVLVGTQAPRLAQNPGMEMTLKGKTLALKNTKLFSAFGVTWGYVCKR